jgi:micrococcal nuclease
MMRRVNLFFLFPLLLFGFSAPRCEGDDGAITVYVTNSGTKYHLETCPALRRSKIAVTLADAASSGYGACSICNPPMHAAPETDAPPAPGERGLYQVNTAPPPGFAAADRLRMLRADVVDSVDGDTIRVRIPRPPSGLRAVEIVRLLGVDTPETVHPSRAVERFGREASAFTERALLNKAVYLAFDWDLRDHYGRLLAYIYTGDGGCFNAVLIREGYAYAYTRYPFQFMEEFRALEQEARTAKRGLWEE